MIRITGWHGLNIARIGFGALDLCGLDIARIEYCADWILCGLDLEH